MFPESFLTNLALFVVGQAAAWFYLRTGRLWLGGIGTAVLWVAADWALMAKYVFAEEGAHFRFALAVMQVSAVLIASSLAVARWRRRWSNTARQRGELFAAGVRAYLRGTYDEAGRIFRRLVRSDPWDAAAWLALGNAHRRSSQPAAARRCYRRCLRVDLSREYSDLANRLQGRTRPVRATAVPRPGGVPAGELAAGATEPAPRPREPARS